MSTTTTTNIDERRPIPAGDHPAALRVMAIYGICPTVFGGDGTCKDFARSAWMWLVRLPDGTLGTMSHLVTLDPSPRSQVRVLAAALLGDASMMTEGHLADGGRLLGRSCILTVGRQLCGGRDRPVVRSARPLPANVSPIAVAEPILWVPQDAPTCLPNFVPQWVRGYANTAAFAWCARKCGEAVKTTLHAESGSSVENRNGRNP